MSTALRLVDQDEPILGKKDYINHFRSNEPKYGVLFTDYIERTISRKARRYNKTYKRNYTTLINHLNAFSQQYEAILYTNSISEEFLEDFLYYLRNETANPLKHNYIKTILDLAKGMAAEAAGDGYAFDPSYKNVELELEECFSIYLSMIDIARIYYFEGLTKKQQRIRDLFVLGCLTGLRYSDYSTLKAEDFDVDFITKATQKTKVTVVIPIHDIVNEIFKKYDGNVSSGLSLQHFNRYLKRICKRIGFTDNVTFSYRRGNKPVTETKQEWELISSHTARRSFATNMVIAGIEPIKIMNITGHTTERSFMRYLKLTKRDTAKQIAGNSFFRK